MAIERVGTPGTGTNSATFPTHQRGDLLIVWAFRDGNATAPTTAPGWKSITNATTTSASARIGYIIAEGAGTPSGTWTNATTVIAAVYRGVDPANPIGGSAVSAGTTSTVTFPTVTMENTGGSSWVVGCVGHRSTNTTIATAPSGMSNWHSITDGTDQAAIHDTNAGVSSWTSANASIGGTASGHCQIVVEINSLEDDQPAVQTIGATLLTAGGVYDWPETYAVTDTITPSNNQFLLLALQYAGSSVPTPTSIGGCNITWTSLASDVLLANTIRAGLYYACPDDPVEGEITIDWSGGQCTNVSWAIIEFEGTAATSSAPEDGWRNSSSVNFTGSTQAGVTQQICGMSDFANQNNATFMVFHQTLQSATAVTASAGGGLDELCDDSYPDSVAAISLHLATYFREDADMQPDATASVSGGYFGARAIELVAAPPVSGSPRTHSPYWSTVLSDGGDLSDPLTFISTINGSNAYSISGHDGDYPKLYFEVNFDTIVGSATATSVGIVNPDNTGQYVIWDNTGIYSSPTTNSYLSGSTGLSLADGDVVGVAVNFTSGYVWMRKNGGAWNPGVTSADPETGVGGAPIDSISISEYYYHAYTSLQTDSIAILYTGQDYPGFANAAPTDFYPWFRDNPAGWSSVSSIDVLLDYGGTSLNTMGLSTIGVAASVTSHDAGQWYFEIDVGELTEDTFAQFGVFGTPSGAKTVWINDVGIQSYPSEDIVGSGTNVSAGHSVGIAVDLDSNEFWLRLDSGSWTPTSTPGTGTGAAIEVSGDDVFVYIEIPPDSAFALNTDTTSFLVAPPSGFQPWYSAVTDVDVDLTTNSVTASVGTVAANGYGLTYWTPADIAADLCVWMQADIIAAADGTALNTLADSGPDGRTFTKLSTNGPVLRHNQLDGKSILEFFSSSKAVATTGFPVSLTNFGVYLVYKGVNASGYLRIVDQHYLNGFYVASGVSNTLIGGGIREGGAAPYGHWITSSPTSWSILTFERSGTTKRLRKNGGAVSDTDRTVSGTSTTSDVIAIGGDNAGGGNFPTDLQLAELVILDANISTDSRDSIEGYLAWKWGLEGNLPVGHAYKDDPPGAPSGGDVDVDLTTNSAEVQVGSVSVSAKANVTLTTNSATASVLSVTADGKVNVTLTTNSASAQVVSVTPSISYNASLTTNSASVFVQNISFTGQANVTLTTNSASAFVQDVSVSAKANVSLTTSGSAEVQVGTVTVDVPVAAGIALVQSAEGTSTSGTTTISFSTAPTAGNLIVLSWLGGFYNNSVNDDWFQCTEHRGNTSGHYTWCRIADGSNSFAYSMDGATQSVWTLAEFSGVDLIDTSGADAIHTAAGNTINTPSIVPTTGERLLIGSVGGFDNSDNLSADTTSWTNSFTHIRTSGTNVAAPDRCVGIAYRVVTGDDTTAYSTEATFPGGATVVDRYGAIVSFQQRGETVGSTAPAFRSYDHITYGARTSTTVNKPSGVVDGDILIANVFVGNSIQENVWTGVTPPAGWTALCQPAANVGAGGFYGIFWTYWKRASSEGSSYTFTHPSSVSKSTQVVITAWSGCIASGSPFDGYSYNYSNTNPYGGYYPAINPRSTNTRLVIVGHEWSGDGADALGGVWTEHYDNVLINLQSRVLASRGDMGFVAVNGVDAPFEGYMFALRGPEDISDIEQVGSVLQFGLNNTAAAGTVSSTITVPDGTEIVLVGLAGYREPADSLKNMTFTKGGVDTPMMRVPGYRIRNIWQGELFYLVLPDTGTNKSLKWDFVNGTYNDGIMNYSLTFWRGIDTDFPVGTSFSKPWIVSGSRPLPMVQDITAVEGDKVVAWLSGYNDANNGAGTVTAWTNLTHLADPAHNLYAEGAWATSSPTTGTISVGVTSVTNMTQGTVSAVVLRQAGSDVPKLSHVAGSGIRRSVSGDTTPTVTTSIVTLKPNSLYIAVGTELTPSGETAQTTISDTEGLTWTLQLREYNPDTGGGGWGSAVYIWTATTGSSPDPTAIAAVWHPADAGPEDAGYTLDIFEATQANLTTPILQTFSDGTGNSSGLTGAYNGDFASATDPSSIILAAVSMNSAYDHGAISTGTGWDQRVEISQPYAFTHIQTKDGGSSDITWDWLDAAGNYSWAIGAVEIDVGGAEGSVDVNLTTNSITAEVGTVTVTIVAHASTTLTTNSVSAEVQSVTVAEGFGVSTTLTTNSAEAQVGTNSFKLDNRLTVTTNSAEAYAGTVIAQTAGAATVAASSQSVEAQVGDVTVRGKANVTQTTNSVSVPSPNTVTIITGVGISETTNSVEAQVGSVTVIAIGGSASVEVITNSAEVQVGTVSVALPRVVTLTTPNALTASVNKVTVPVNLTGNSITASVGNAVTIQAVEIELEGMDLFIPELSEEEGFIVESNNNLSVTGEQAAIIEVGSVEVSGSTIIEEELRFSGQEVGVELGTISLVLHNNITVDSMPISLELGMAFSTNWGTVQVDPDTEPEEKWTEAGSATSEEWDQQGRDVIRSDDGWIRIIGHG